MAKTTRKATTHNKNTRRKPASAKEASRPAKTTARSEGKKQAGATSGDRPRKSVGKPCTAGEMEVTVDRRRSDRRIKLEPGAAARRQLERREKVTRRRQIDPTTCERDYSDDEVEFMSALDNYKRASGRMFPTCSEILEVIRSLGYSKSPVAKSGSIGGPETVTQETTSTGIPVWTDEGEADSMIEDVVAFSEIPV